MGVACGQLLLIQIRDPIGYAQHVLAPGKNLIAQERIPQPAPLIRVPLKHRSQRFPITIQLASQSHVLLDLFGIVFAAVGFERGVHLAPDLLQAGAMAFRPRRFRFQQIVPDQRAGKIHFGPNVVQDVVPRKKLAADHLILGPDILEHPQSPCPGHGHDGQQTTQSHD